MAVPHTCNLLKWLSYTSTKQISPGWIHEGCAGCLTSCEKTPWIRSRIIYPWIPKTRCANNRRDFATRLEFTKLTAIMFSHFLCWTKGHMLCFLIIFFSRETPHHLFPPGYSSTLMSDKYEEKIHNCLNFTKLPRDLRSCFAPRRKSRLEKSGHENDFENTKMRQ